MWVYNMNVMKNWKVYTLLLPFTALLIEGCKKETDYVYGVNDVEVNPASAAKNNVKSTIEFVSIAYSDIFGSTIPQSYLQNLSLAYLAFGDKKLIEDVIIKNMLNTPGVQFPTQDEVLNNVDGFITNSYKKFYNRNPSEYELWQMRIMIQSDPSVTPEIIYYAFLTSDEYRYY